MTKWHRRAQVVGCSPSTAPSSECLNLFPRPRWEPIWEPTALDFCGRLWTPVDTAWRSTNQEVGGSSPSGRAAETPVLRGCHRAKFATVEDMGHVFWVVSWSARHRDRCACSVRDEASRTETIRVHRENFSVHGVPKTWAHQSGISQPLPASRPRRWRRSEIG